MAFTLHAATIPSYLQILNSVSHLLNTAEAFCAEEKIPPVEILQARLAEDMLPFAYQVKSTAVHSMGAIEGVRKGTFSPERSTPPDSFEGLRARVAQAVEGLTEIEPEEIESFIGRDMRFEFGSYRMEFLAEDFLLSFSQPNFYFHATTAYDILRMKGIQIGKRDFIGRLRLKL